MNASNGLQYFYPLHADTVARAARTTQALKEIQRKGGLLPPGQLSKFKLCFFANGRWDE
jgi:hypothetical protein